MTLSTFRAVLGAAAILSLSACAPVQIIEDHDPRIEEGMTEYQRALTVFVGRTLANYETCEILQPQLAAAQAMRCPDGSAEARAMCEEAIAEELAELTAETEEACGAASYNGSRRSFYVEQEAHLSVLQTRASILDSMGICVGAMDTVLDLVGSALPDDLRSAVDTDAEQVANNCTEIVVNIVLENHRAMGQTHRCIDEPTLDGCEDFAEEDLATWNAPLQAGFYFPIALDTLQQNIHIVLLLEEAKKRGDDSNGG